MATDQIGVKELQKTISEVIRSVQDRGHQYQVTVQGRPSGVVISRAAPASGSGATAAEMLASPLYSSAKPPGLAEAQVAELERGRDEAGIIGVQDGR
jgi:prevent-host-death family protein